MTRPLLFSLAPEANLGPKLAAALDWELGSLELRRFPDGETYLRYESPVAGRPVALLCSLDRPDAKLAPLLFAAAAARELGATEIGLIAPYLAYMRQDTRFKPGEALTAATFAHLLSAHLDWLVTVDPHLHRYKSLADIYTIPTIALHAAPLISAWITREVARPLLIGPDEESAQWVAAVADAARAPHRVLVKVRHGDRDVEISLPDVAGVEGRTPVLVDDIASTARTMIETVGRIRAIGLPPPVCIVVHGIFAGDAYQELKAAGAGRIVSTNAIAHESNAMDITDLLAQGCRRVASPVDLHQGTGGLGRPS